MGISSQVAADLNLPRQRIPFLRKVVYGQSRRSFMSHDTYIELLRLLIPISDFEDFTPYQLLEYTSLLFTGDSVLYSWVIRQMGCSLQHVSLQ